MHHDETYFGLCRRILGEGERQPTRTGVDAISIFGAQCVYDLRDGFPLLTTKKINFEAVKAELFWFLGGDMHIDKLPEKFRFIWEPWAFPNGECGPIYGKQWVNWWSGHGYLDEYDQTWVMAGINQIANVIERLKKNPTDRQLIVSAWNAADISNMCLPPCHVIFQLKGYPPYLDLMMYQRSCDTPVGVPFNIASYALLLSMIAQEVGLTPRRFIHSLGDAHIYADQVPMLEKQMSRTPPAEVPFITIAEKPFWDLREGDVTLWNYHPLPFIKFPVAV